MNDLEYMNMALELAAQGVGRVAPNPMVGAVVVKEGRIIGRGCHQRVGGPHAEVHAIDDAGADTRGATLYVTLEPCNHHGRTPPCTEKIVAAGISRVVLAMADPNPDVRGGGVAFLRTRGIEVITGVGEAQARRLNEIFIKYVITKRPFAVLKLAATLDGRIATRVGDARWVTGEAARAHAHNLRHALDAIMVGIGTVLADDPQLTARLPDGGGKDPQRIVLDRRLRMPSEARMLRQKSEAPTYVICGSEAPASDRQRLIAAGAQVLEVPTRDGRINLAALMELLGAMGITSVLIEGGGQVAAAALAADIVDKVVFYYAPKILGGDDGVPMFHGSGPIHMREALTLREATVDRLGEDIVVQGYLRRFE
jgi:diaminohydroxyphosphoribosylaminopyrimidine deaminase/5-amino-6-(5-phosphoribosylamino)uracil reductase